MAMIVNRYINAVNLALNPFLEGLDGSIATLWSYAVSLRQITVRLQRHGERSNNHLVCLACTKIAAPTQWDRARIRIVIDAASTTPDPLYRICDEGEGVIMCCGVIQLVENVEPFYEVP